LKILQLVQTLDPSTGGVARAVLASSKELAARGHATEIVALDEPSALWVIEAGLPIHALGRGVTSYGYSKTLLPWLRRHRQVFDRVIVNGLWQYHSFAAWRSFAGSAVPYYVFPHGMLDPWFKRTFPRKHLKKWLYWPWAEYRVLRDAEAVIFTSEEERLQARESFWLYRCRERIMPLGVETPAPAAPDAREEFLVRYPELRSTRILLFLGRLHPKKGCDLLIEALARRTPGSDALSLVLAGPNQIGWVEKLRARIAELRLAAPVVFTGMLEREMKRAALEAADVFVLPSHQENFGLSVAEALAVGLPVLISDRVNIWREIAADAAGYVESDDLAGTERLIERWVQTPPQTRVAMRANARKCFAGRFEIHRAVDSLLDLLHAPVCSAAGQKESAPCP
jgi:glycosyltransferase involved in cell wall biosynthesis